MYLYLAGHLFTIRDNFFNLALLISETFPLSSLYLSLPFTYRVVYFSIHRYEHGNFWPNLRESDFDFIGKEKGAGYNFNVPLNNTGMADADYLAIFQQVLLPMACEVISLWKFFSLCSVCQL